MDVLARLIRVFIVFRNGDEKMGDLALIKAKQQEYCFA
jgi:hypothetical protein